MHQRLLPDGVDRRPEWLTVKLPGGDGYTQIKNLMRGLDLVTVCEEARCPNIAECWGHGTATFMILGEVCTRACAFCAVTSGKRGGDIDADEPRRVATAVAKMGLAHAVVTSVDRDDLPDFGAEIFAQTIREIRRQAPGTTIEVLTPDFNGEPGVAAGGDGDGAGDLQPQPRDDLAVVRAGASQGGIPAAPARCSRRRSGWSRAAAPRAASWWGSARRWTR